MKVPVGFQAFVQSGLRVDGRFDFQAIAQLCYSVFLQIVHNGRQQVRLLLARNA